MSLSVQLATIRWQSLVYVFPSDPQTGFLSSVQESLQTHSALLFFNSQILSGPHGSIRLQAS